MEKTALSTQLSHKNNFDFLRFFFALSVAFGHYYVLTGREDCFWPISTGKAVAGFFIISGFLITWSYCNNSNLKEYFTKRAKRIIPACYVVIIACSLLFCFISILSYSDYFRSSHFYKYLVSNLSFLNFIEPKLPGVFLDNIISAVNGSLWTIKVEIALYFCVPVYCYLMKRMNKCLILSVIYVMSIVFSEYCSYLFDKTGNELYSILGRQFIGQLKYFISGAILLFYFDVLLNKLKIFFPIAVAVFFAEYFTATFPDYLAFFIDCLFPISFAVFILGFAYGFNYLNHFGKYGDFSYGIYLIHYPVIQTLLHFKLHEYNFLLTLCLAITITILLAALSWHGVEKHFLKRK